ncbi:hypothetical protein AKJ16_DCAP22330 [Drosera capensis]
MAQLLSPVCTDPLKLLNPVRDTCLVRSGWNVYARRRNVIDVGGDTKRRRSSVRVKVADDYYSVLGLVLSDPVQRMVYDEIHGYSLTAINPFLDDTSPKDHVFVDEFNCIGPNLKFSSFMSIWQVFRIEEDYGRARAYNQSGNPDLVQQAIDNCIHWTSAQQLSLLEDEMRRVERVNVALMLMGSASTDVFRMANSRWEKRQWKILEQARFRMMKRNASGEADEYWSNVWGKPKEYQNSEEEVKERAKRAAEAARRWREYSRRGVDKPPAYKLPETISNKE